MHNMSEAKCIRETLCIVRQTTNAPIGFQEGMFFRAKPQETMSDIQHIMSKSTLREIDGSHLVVTEDKIDMREIAVDQSPMSDRLAEIVHHGANDLDRFFQKGEV